MSKDGWIDWRGGRRPVPAKDDVAVRFRSAAVAVGKGSVFRWGWTGSDRKTDIIAYRIVENGNG